VHGRRATMTLLCFVASAQLGGGCGERKDEGGGSRSQLAEPGVLARVAAAEITREEVVAVMKARGLDARGALDALVRDTALATTSAGSAQANALPTLALSRRLLQSLSAQTQAPATEEEVMALAQRRWLEFDRPASHRITHAVVVCDPCADPVAARAVAERISTATAGSTEAAGFRAAAEAVEAAGFTVSVEDLQPVAEDGRIVDLERLGQLDQNAGTLHLEFAQAAARLPAVGSHSGVVQSPSGFHVLLLTERLPEHRVPLVERTRTLTPEIQSARAKALLEQTLTHAKEQWPVEVSRSVAQDTELILLRP
jgi:hypothetical protein